MELIQMITPIEKVHSVTLLCLLNCGTLRIDHLLKKLFFFFYYLVEK